MNYEKFVKSLPSDEPCGIDPFENPALYARLQSLDRLREGTPAQELLEPLMKNGNVETVVKVIPAQPPKWQEFKKECEGVLHQTRHLRAVVLYGVGALHLEGLYAVPQTLAFLCELLEGNWDQLYPRLDGEDASERLREINELSTPDGNDPADAMQPDPQYKDGFFLAHLRDIPLFKLSDGKPITFRLWEAASDSDLHPGSNPPPLAVIQGALGNVPESDREEKRKVLTDSIAGLERLEHLLSSRKATANLRRLWRVLETMRSWLAGGASASPSGGGGGHSTVATHGGLPTVIRNRDEVRQTLQALRSYFETVEPSSPVLLLLQLAERFLGRSFLEIVNKRLPDDKGGLAELLLNGIRDKLADNPALESVQEKEAR